MRAAEPAVSTNPIIFLPANQLKFEMCEDLGSRKATSSSQDTTSHFSTSILCRKALAGPPGLKKQSDFALSEADLFTLWNFHSVSFFCKNKQSISDVLELQVSCGVSSDKCFRLSKRKSFDSYCSFFVRCNNLFDHWFEIGFTELGAPFLLFWTGTVIHFAHIRDWLFQGWDPPWSSLVGIEICGED